MSKKYLTPNGVKDENGQFVRVFPVAEPEAPKALESARGASIDELLGKGLYALDLLVKSLLEQISSHSYDRETIINLKDAMSMLHELKKKEKDLLDGMTEDELTQVLLNASNTKGSGSSP